MNLNKLYAIHKQIEQIGNKGDRLLEQYRKIVWFGGDHTKILDIGSGNRDFRVACAVDKMECQCLDYPFYNAETDNIPFEDKYFHVVTLNAVIEHIKDPSTMMSEIKRVLKPNGKLFIRTTNFQQDYKNFYNDPTHVKPYTPLGLQRLLELYGFDVIFCEPGLILKSKFWYHVPFKWHIAKMLKGGTRSIIIVGKKK